MKRRAHLLLQLLAQWLPLLAVSISPMQGCKKCLTGGIGYWGLNFLYGELQGQPYQLVALETTVIRF